MKCIFCSNDLLRCYTPHEQVCKQQPMKETWTKRCQIILGVLVTKAKYTKHKTSQRPTRSKQNCLPHANAMQKWWVCFRHRNKISMCSQVFVERVASGYDRTTRQPHENELQLKFSFVSLSLKHDVTTTLPNTCLPITLALHIHSSDAKQTEFQTLIHQIFFTWTILWDQWHGNGRFKSHKFPLQINPSCGWFAASADCPVARTRLHERRFSVYPPRFRHKLRCKAKYRQRGHKETQQLFLLHIYNHARFIFISIGWCQRQENVTIRCWIWKSFHFFGFSAWGFRGLGCFICFFFPLGWVGLGWVGLGWLVVWRVHASPAQPSGSGGVLVVVCWNMLLRANRLVASEENELNFHCHT